MNDQWRLTVRLRSHRALREYMEFHRIPTAYALAKRARQLDASSPRPSPTTHLAVLNACVAGSIPTP